MERMFLLTVPQELADQKFTHEYRGIHARCSKKLHKSSRLCCGETAELLMRQRLN
jgi:hypothetical protein